MLRTGPLTACLHGYDWDPVIDRMREVAEETDDAFLASVTERLAGDVFMHEPGGVGCCTCEGVATELCTDWAASQRTMLIWLLGQVRD